MRSRRIALLVGLILATVGLASPARAQTTPTPVSVTYTPGWTMVGGPAGTDFSKIAPLYVWTGTSYVNPPSNEAVPCQGYWALVAVATTVTLAPSTATSQTCSLQFGWNLVGDPFTGPAVLPYGTAGQAVNPATGGYMQVPAIPPGGAVWVYADAPTTLTLTEAPTSRTPVTLSISTIPSGPYTVHVGDVVQLFLPASPIYTAAASDPSLLSFDNAGVVETLSCIGEPSCAFTTTRQYWQWHAVAPGKAFINLAPICPDGTTNCGSVTSIEIDVQS